MCIDSGRRHGARTPIRSIASILACLLLATPAFAKPAATVERKTLDRPHDPIIVSGADMAGLPDRHTARLRLYRASEGVLDSIPYQFDQRDSEGWIVAPAPDEIRAASQASAAQHREPEFLLDDNDELVFMARDTGDRFAPGRSIPGSDWAAELAVHDPRSGARGWAYLVHFPPDGAGNVSSPPRASERYAHFDVNRDRVVTPHYELQYAPGYSFFTGMQITKAAGGSGDDIVKSMRIRVRPTFSLLVAHWSPKVSEDDFEVEVEAVRNGPVRAVRRVRQRLELGGLLPVTPTSTVSTYYYFSSFHSPATVSVPSIALRVLSDFEFVGVTEFIGGTRMKYWDGANLNGIELGSAELDSAAASRAERNVDHDWWAVRSPGGSCVHAFLLPEEWKQWGIIRGTTLSDPYAAKESSRGLMRGPELGYSLLNMTEMRHGGTWEVQMATLIPLERYAPGDESHALNMLRAPLETRVRPATRPPTLSFSH